MTDPTARELGRLLGLIVHDLRNPASAVFTNIEHARGALDGTASPDVVESVDDSRVALRDLLLGLEQLGCVGAWLRGESLAEGGPDDVVAAVRGVSTPRSRELLLELPGEPVRVSGAGAAVRTLVEILVQGAAWHSRRGPIRVSVYTRRGQAMIEVVDAGPALAADLRSVAFTLEGQHDLKGRGDGRYVRGVGLFAAKLLAEALGGTISAGGGPTEAIFRVALPLAEA